MKTYTARATRGERGWELRLDGEFREKETGRVSSLVMQSHSLVDARRMVAGAIESWTGEPGNSFAVEITFRFEPRDVDERDALVERIGQLSIEVAELSDLDDSEDRREVLSRYQSPLQWRRSTPPRVSKHWYFLVDNTIPDFQLHLQKFGDTGHGEVRCSSASRDLLDGSDEARRMMIGSYGNAEMVAGGVFVDISDYAVPPLREAGMIMHPGQLRRAAKETMADLGRASGKTLRDDQRDALVAKYGRIREGVAALGAELAGMEAMMDRLHLKVADVLGDVD